MRARFTLPARRRRAPLEHLVRDSYRWIYSRDGSGPPLLLIHGLSGSVRWWQRNIPVLSRSFTVYAVELQGFGGNRNGRPLPFRESADSLAAFMGALGIERAHIAGHSMGGHIAIYLAAYHPERVNRLVLAAPSGMLRRGLPHMVLRLATHGRYEAPSFVPTVVMDALRAGPVNLLLAARAILRDDVETLLQSISAPTLVIAGERDALVPPGVSASLAAAIKAARFVVLKGAAHNLMWDRHTAFNQAVLEFLQEGSAAYPAGEPGAEGAARATSAYVEDRDGSPAPEEASG